MNRFERELHLNRVYGQTIGFIANVINLYHERPISKLKVLEELAKENRISTGTYNLDTVLVDGSSAQLSELEKFSKHALPVPNKEALRIQLKVRTPERPNYYDMPGEIVYLKDMPSDDFLQGYAQAWYILTGEQPLEIRWCFYGSSQGHYKMIYTEAL